MSQHLGGVKHYIFELAFFRNRIHVGFLVAVIVGLQLGIGGFEALENVVFLDDRVIELDLGVLLFKLLPDFCVRNRGTGADKIAQLVDQDVLFYELLELWNRIAVAGNKVVVRFLSDEVAPGEDHLPKLSLMQELAKIVIGGLHVHAMGLRQQNLLADESLRRALRKERQQRIRLRSTAGKLLLQ